MENVEKLIDCLRKKKVLQKEHFSNEEKKQTTEYNDLMNTLQTLKGERIFLTKSISENLESLTTHKHSVYKFIHNFEKVKGLPFTQDYVKQVTSFLSDGIDFVNKWENVHENLSINNDEKNITNLIHNIVSSANSVGNEVYNIKFLVAEVNALQKNVDTLVEYCLDNDEDVDL